MPLKIHLIIIMCIVLVVSVAWELTQRLNNNTPGATGSTDARRIAITHASLGLNCRGAMVSNTAAQPATGKETVPALREDNVFSAVSLMCNGKTECTVSATDSALGKDPAPDCTPKTLEIEYRCFSYDRPWSVKSSGGSVKLECRNAQ